MEFFEDELFPPGYVKRTRGKRPRSVNDSPVELNVETLLVVDPTVYQDHKKYLKSTDDNLIFDHIRVYYAHLFNGVNAKYQNSFSNDPELRINIKLVHVLIITVQNF